MHRNCVSQLAGAIDHVDLNNMPTDWMSIHWRHQLTSSSSSSLFALFLKTQSISETLFLRSTVFDCSVHYNKPTGSGADFNWSLPICRTWLLLSCSTTTQFLLSANVKVKVILLAGTICVCVCLRGSSSTLKKVVIRERKRFCAGGGGGSLVHWVNWWCKGKVCLWLAVAALSCDICVCCPSVVVWLIWFSRRRRHRRLVVSMSAAVAALAKKSVNLLLIYKLCVCLCVPHTVICCCCCCCCYSWSSSPLSNSIIFFVSFSFFQLFFSSVRSTMCLFSVLSVGFFPTEKER